MKVRTALMVVDVQNALVEAGPDDVGGVLDRCAALLKAARDAGLPVAHVQHSDPVGEELEPGQPGWELAPPVRPMPGEPVFPKRFNSSFKDTGVEAWLDGQGIETLVIAGMQTEYCIDATVKSAFEKGYHVVVPQGAHTTFANGALTPAQLRDFYENRIWKGRYAAVESVESLASAWKAAQTPRTDF